jgi:hypothetical protein
MMRGNTEDRREHERFAMKVDMRARAGDRVIDIATEDLSIGGARVQWADDAGLQTGQTIEVDVLLPGRSEPLRADAEVRWTNTERRQGGLMFGKAARVALAAFFAGVVGLGSTAASANQNATVPGFDPNATVQLEAEGGERPDEFYLLAAFEQQQEVMDRCVEAAKDGNDEQLKGWGNMEVLLNPQGKRPLGINAKLDGEHAKNATLVECLRRATAGAPYPSYDGPPVVVEFNFELDAGHEIVDDDD